jgi:hypothetical protein
MKRAKGFNGIETIRVSQESLRDIVIEEIPSTMIGYGGLLNVSINELIFIFGKIEPCRRFTRVYESLSWADKKRFQYCIPFSVHQGTDKKWAFLVYGGNKKDRFLKVLAQKEIDGRFTAIRSFEGINQDQFLGLMIQVSELRISEI